MAIFLCAVRQSRLATAIAAVSVSVFLLNNVGQAEANSAFVDKCLTKYRELEKSAGRWKAIAANTASNGKQACGWVADFPSKSAAISMAMRQCRVSEKRHPTWGKQGTCKVRYIK